MNKIFRSLNHFISLFLGVIGLLFLSVGQFHFALRVSQSLGKAFSRLFAPAPVKGSARLRQNARNQYAGGSLAKLRYYNATPITQAQMTAITNIGVALRAVFMDQMQALVDPTSILSLYNVQSSNRAQEKNQGVGGFGLIPEYTGTSIPADSFELLYGKTYVHKEYAQQMAVERKLIDDDEYGVMAQRARLLGMAFDRTVEYHASSMYVNAFSSSYLGADSKALCATDHPYSPTDSTTQSNKGTTALSHDSLIAARIAMMKFKDSRGNPMLVRPDTLVVPIDLGPTARVIVESAQKSGVANNDTNVNRSYNIIENSYMTDTNNWFLVDSRLARMYANWFWRVRPEFAEDANSNFNLALRYRGYMRYSFGWDTWQWVYGSEVA